MTLVDKAMILGGMQAAHPRAPHAVQYRDNALPHYPEKTFFFTQRLNAEIFMGFVRQAGLDLVH